MFHITVKYQLPTISSCLLLYPITNTCASKTECLKPMMTPMNWSLSAKKSFLKVIKKRFYLRPSELLRKTDRRVDASFCFDLNHPIMKELIDSKYLQRGSIEKLVEKFSASTDHCVFDRHKVSFGFCLDQQWRNSNLKSRLDWLNITRTTFRVNKVFMARSLALTHCNPRRGCTRGCRRCCRCGCCCRRRHCGCWSWSWFIWKEHQGGVRYSTKPFLFLWNVTCKTDKPMY